VKVLHLPTSVGGQAFGLSRGERAIGLDSRVLTLYDNSRRYPADYAWHLERHASPVRLAGHVAAFLRHRSGFDAYHFNYGSSLVHFLSRGILLWDLPYYDSRARKVFTFNGCDARQKYPMMARALERGTPAACLEPACYGGMCNSGEMDRHRRRAIDKAARHADHFFTVNLDLLPFLPAEMTSFLPYTVAGFGDIPARRLPLAPDGRVRIVHAPTEQVAKGSRYIRAALERLKGEFPDRLDLVVVENLPHDEALRVYATADLFIDQVLLGWYGGTAVEVMKMGIPVVCFVNEAQLALAPAALAGELPVISAGPFDLVEQLRPLLREPEQLSEIGRRSRAFVERWHDPSRLAAISAAVYEGRSAPSLESVCAP
jgi:glycosyltransferase involved in cell wall biosynthesis